MAFPDIVRRSKIDSEIERVKNWQRQVDLGLEYRKKYAKEDAWDKILDYFHGDQTCTVPLNILYAMVKVLVPNIYLRNPYINVTARQAEYIPLARIRESLLNALLYEMRAKTEFKRAALFAVLRGVGLVEVGYDADEDMPWVAAINPADFVVSWGATSLEDAEWVAKSVLRRVDDVKRDDRFKNTRDLKGTYIARKLKDDRNFWRKRTQEGEWVNLWEIRDGREGKIVVIADDYDRILLEDDDILQSIFGYPFEALRFNDDGLYFWCVSDAHLIIPQQEELNEVKEQIRAHRKLALSKWIAKRNVLTAEAKDILLNSDEPLPLIELDGEVSDIKEITPSIPQDLYLWENRILEDVRLMLGLSRVQMGEFTPPSKRATATEVQAVQIAHQLRMDERRDAMADFIERVMTKVDDLIIRNWTTERVVEVIGIEGARYWVRITGDDLKGKFTMKVDVESMTPQTKALRKHEIIELIGALAKVPNANINELLRALLYQYEWVDVMKVLPVAQEQPMSINEFVQRQNEIARKMEAGEPIGGQAVIQQGGGEASSANLPVSMSELLAQMGGNTENI